MLGKSVKMNFLRHLSVFLHYSNSHGALGWFDCCDPKPGLAPSIPVQGAPEGQEGPGRGGLAGGLTVIVH